MNYVFWDSSALRRRAASALLLVACVLMVATTAFPNSADDVQQLAGQDVKQALKQAEKLTKKGNLLEAERLLRAALATEPSNSRVQSSLSYVFLKQRRFLEAYTIALEAAKSDSKNSRAFAMVGMSLLSFGKFPEARALFIRSVQINNREPFAWAGMGMLDFYENRIDNSIDKLQTAEYFENNEPDFTFALAQVYARAERYREAAEAYNRFLAISPTSDSDRRNRIKGLIGFLRYLGNKSELYKVESRAKQTVVPVQISRDRPIIEVSVNGREDKLRFVLDTGSGISVISEATAERLKIKSVSKGGLARAVGGDGKFEIVYGFLRNVGIGDVRISNVPVYIRKFHDDQERVDGYIGLSLISKFLTTMDYGDSTFTLTKKSKETLENFDREGVALPLRLTSSGFLSGEVQLPGIETPLNFIVDTGASISVISTDLAGTDEVKPFGLDEKMRVVGAAGVTENVRSFMLPKVSFGTHSRESVKAIELNLNIINEASGFEQAGILGGNFLKNYRLTFDFQNSRVTFVPVSKK